jgi:hypothetical protein
MPELSDALHDLYEEEARSFSTPSRGLNVLAAEARGARRRAVLQASGVSAFGVIAVGGLVLGSLEVFGGDGGAVHPGTGSSAAPSNQQEVTWDPWGAFEDAMAGFTMPRCGEAFAPESVSVGGVIPVPYGEVHHNPNGVPETLFVGDDFTATETTDFLALPGSVVFTREGVVVGVKARFAESLTVYTTDEFSGSGAEFSSSFTCAHDAAWEAEIAAEYPNYPSLTPEEKLEVEARQAVFEYEWQGVPSGEYAAYVVTPVIFGPQLAVAKEIEATGVPHVGMVLGDIGSTPFADDPRIAFYCQLIDNGSSGFYNLCDPPIDVLQEVMTFEIDPGSVLDIPSGVAISEPLYLTVP